MREEYLILCRIRINKCLITKNNTIKILFSIWLRRYCIGIQFACKNVFFCVITMQPSYCDNTHLHTFAWHLLLYWLKKILQCLFMCYHAKKKHYSIAKNINISILCIAININISTLHIAINVNISILYIATNINISVKYLCLAPTFVLAKEDIAMPFHVLSRKKKTLL